MVIFQFAMLNYQRVHPKPLKILELVSRGASDGRVAVWGLQTGSPLWGFRGLTAESEDLEPVNARWG